MDVAAFCRQSRVWIVAGKGGVGKTTIAAALADAAADAGLSVLLVELEGRRGLPVAFGRPDPLGYDECVLWPPSSGDGAGGPGASQEDKDGGGGRRPRQGTGRDDRHAGQRRGSGQRSGDGRSRGGRISGRRITPDDALLEYLADHGLRRVSKRLVSSGVLDAVATAIPGIRDILVLGKVKQIERAGTADLVVIDAPATGHAMTFLSSAGGLLDAARSGPVRTQAAEVAELLADPARCRVMLVTLPEELPVSETIEAAYQLEDRVGVQLGPVVVNFWDDVPTGLAIGANEAADAAGAALSPAQRSALDAARLFRIRRGDLAAQQVRRLRDELPLPQLRVPRLAPSSIGPRERRQLASALAAEIDGLRVEAGLR